MISFVPVLFFVIFHNFLNYLPLSSFLEDFLLKAFSSSSNLSRYLLFHEVNTSSWDFILIIQDFLIFVFPLPCSRILWILHRFFIYVITCFFLHSYNNIEILTYKSSGKVGHNNGISYKKKKKSASKSTFYYSTPMMKE